MISLYLALFLLITASKGFTLFVNLRLLGFIYLTWPVSFIFYQYFITQGIICRIIIRAQDILVKLLVEVVVD